VGLMFASLTALSIDEMHSWNKGKHNSSKVDLWIVSEIPLDSVMLSIYTFAASQVVSSIFAFSHAIVNAFIAAMFSFMLMFVSLKNTSTQ